jgi:hypothetical protein
MTASLSQPFEHRHLREYFHQQTQCIQCPQRFSDVWQGEDFDQLISHSFGRNADQGGGSILDERLSAGIYLEPKLGRQADRAQPAHRIFPKGMIRNGAQPSCFEVSQTSMGINERMRDLVYIHRHSVQCEITTSQVSLQIWSLETGYVHDVTLSLGVSLHNPTYTPFGVKWVKGCAERIGNAPGDAQSVAWHGEVQIVPGSILST